MPAGPRPPAYAWNWFARQRLCWREAHRRLAHPAHPAAARYGAVGTKGQVINLLRADYPRDSQVRAVVDAVVAELVFLDRTDVPFSALGVPTPPRGMRWWWAALTGEEVGAGRRRPHPPTAQLTLDDVHEGYGG